MADTIPLRPAAADLVAADPVEALREHPAAGLPSARVAPSASRSLADKFLIDMAELAYLTSLSVRELRRRDSSRDIPGRVTAGRRVLFQTEAIREWVRAGLPGRDQWAALQKRNGTKR